MTKDRLAILVEKLLQKNNISFDKEELSFQIQGHPSYPSMHAITGVLQHFNIDNIAAEVPSEEASMAHLPESFLAQVGSEFTVVTQGNKGIQVFDSSLKTRRISTEDFLKDFTGIVVVVDEKAESKASASTNTNIGLALAAILAIALFVFSGINTLMLAHLLLSVAGLAISHAIWKQESGAPSTIGNAFCGEVSEVKDCSAILSSKGAKVLGRYKLSDLSLTYFGTLSLSALIFITLEASSNALLYTALLATPITLYSIYYQALVVKKWCMLCLSIVGILWLQAGLAVYLLEFQSMVLPLNTLLIALLGVLIGLSWSWTRKKMESLESAKSGQMEYVKFRRNFKLFKALLDQGKSINTDAGVVGEITFGNPAAPTQITLLSNPFCIHCKGVHRSVEELIKHYHQLVGITIRFSVKMADEESDPVRVSARLLEIFHKEGASKCLEAMNDIYGDMDRAAWFAKWQESHEREPYLSILKMGKAWCTDNGLNFTPEILINGRSYPAEYPREDLVYFIDELDDEAAQLTQENTQEEVLA